MWDVLLTRKNFALLPTDVAERDLVQLSNISEKPFLRIFKKKRNLDFKAFLKI